MVRRKSWPRAGETKAVSLHKCLLCKTDWMGYEELEKHRKDYHDKSVPCNHSINVPVFTIPIEENEVPENASGIRCQLCGEEIDL